MGTNRNLTIILSVYNPHDGWDKELLHSFPRLKDRFSDIDYCITIVNDGSTTNVENTIKNLILPYHKNVYYSGYRKNMGKGFAIRHGLELSSSDYYIYCDFDFPFGIDALREIYEILAAGKTNLVMASRNFFSIYKKLPFWRCLLSLSLFIINSIITRFRVKDTQAGLKGLDNKARDVFLTTKTNSFVFDIEFILKCLKADLKYSFVKVVPNHNIKFTNFGLKVIKRELINYSKILLGRK